MALILDFELDNKKDYVKTLWPKKRLSKENLIIYQRKAKCLYRWDESAITTEMFFFWKQMYALDFLRENKKELDPFTSRGYQRKNSQNSNFII